MATFQVETKNQVGVDQKPRVYFTCHPNDFEKYFRKICDDIFKTHDCAIYYTEDMTNTIAEDEKETDLGRNNLFVVPVTFKLLSTPNRAMDEDIPYARNAHIPVLPIMMETGIDALYAKDDKFGELQYLNPYSTDVTEISYGEKLKKHLDTVLISDELAQRIRAAFDAYIFLSYRKKDRKYANQLMKMIHNHSACRDIAIWFDEFLTPGESFREVIEKMLEDCKLFTLLVTPQLLEKVVDETGNERDNYVISTELPLARKKKEEKGTDILPVEMAKTDKEKLSHIDIHDAVYFEDETFKTRLLQSVSGIATSMNNTPEHNFLIGLAYLEGIDVEVNRERGTELITSAAEAGLLEAMQKLYEMYYEGIGNCVDYKKALYWAEKIADYAKEQYGEEHPETLTYLDNVATAYTRLGKQTEAISLQENVYALSRKVLGEEHPDTLVTLGNMACTYGKLGEYKKEIETLEAVYEIRQRILGEEHPDTLTTLNNLAVAYGHIASFEKALEVSEKAYAQRCKMLGEEDPDTLISLGNLALAYSDAGFYKKALEMQEKAYERSCKVQGEMHPRTLVFLDNVASAHMRLGNSKKALEILEQVYEKDCAVLGEEHPEVLAAMNNLALAYFKRKNMPKALEMSERVYEKSRTLLGEAHPDTLSFLNNLATIFIKDGNMQKAMELYEKGYELSCKALGEDHPDTLTALANIAYAHTKLGNFQKALEIYENTYEQKCKALGEDHPETLVCLNNIALSYNHLGNDKTAFVLLKEVYEKRCQVLGEKNRETISTLQKLIKAASLSGNKTAEVVYKSKLKRMK